MTASLTATLAPQAEPQLVPPRSGSTFHPGTRLSPASLIGVLLVHAGLLAALLLVAADKVKTVTPPRPLMVSLIEAEQPEPEPEVRPTPPQTVVKPQTPPPMLVAKRTAPPPQPAIEAPRPDPHPEPVPEVLPPPAPVVAEAPKPAPPPPPPTPPRSADYLNNPKPPYPRLSKKLREEGTVLLRALINPDGSVAKLELLKSSGYERLDTSAYNTVKNSWKFEPARQNGQPVAEWVNFPVEFTLKTRS
jgi:protein TonB